MRALREAVAIVNPKAGNGRARARWRAVSRRLEAEGVRCDFVETRSRGDGVRLAREAIQTGHKLILAVGGDGTVHEVVNGFLHRGHIHDDVLLGVVPAGTGMDFARNVGLPRRPDLVASRILSGDERRLDVGILNSARARLFVNFAETGMGAAVVAREARMSEVWPGRLSFLLAAMRASLDRTQFSASITIDGTEVYDGPLVSVVVANGPYFGAGMKIAPNASMHDGRLDVLILGDFTRPELVAQIWKLYPGIHIKHRKVMSLLGEHVEIVPHSAAQVDLDGELGGNAPYSFRIAHRAIRVLV